MVDTPFTPEIVGWAQAAQKKYQIPSSLNLSVAMVESSLGKKTPRGSNNWHGIKAANGVVSSTREETAGGVSYTIQAGFHVFKSPADSFMYFGWLLGLSHFYRGPVTKFLGSSRTPDDVQELTRAVAPIYATAHNYADVNIYVQKQNDLYKFDALAAAPVAQPAPAPVAPAPTQETSNMFSFSSLFSILTNAPTVLNAAVTVGEEAITDVEALLKTPGILALEAFINSNFTHVSTPGAASILEPKSTTPGKA